MQDHRKRNELIAPWKIRATQRKNEVGTQNHLGKLLEVAIGEQINFLLCFKTSDVWSKLRISEIGITQMKPNANLINYFPGSIDVVK